MDDQQRAALLGELATQAGMERSSFLDEAAEQFMLFLDKHKDRIKQLGGRIPGSLELEFDQTAMQPPEDPANARSVVEGVLQAEEAAIAHYRKLIEIAGDEDPVTADLATRLLALLGGQVIANKSTHPLGRRALAFIACRPGALGLLGVR